MQFAAAKQQKALDSRSKACPRSLLAGDCGSGGGCDCGGGGRMRRAIERGWQRRGWPARLLFPLSLVYSAGMAARRWAYRAGIFARHQLPAPLVVVGNLCVGGAGKTPLVMALVEEFKRRGFHPGIIARGYKARRGNWPRFAAADAAADEVGEVGDEAALLARRCRVPVMAGPDRRRSAEELIRRHACDLIVSDDGFQHLALRRDLDIVVVDARRRFGNGFCLPAGPLRELPSALARADIVVANCGGEDGGGDSAPGEYRMRTRIARAVSIGGGNGGGGREIDLREFANRRVHAIAGIGHPARFFRQLRAFGMELAAHPFPDHHHFTAADFAFAAADDAILMTEKDAVKCESLVAGGRLRGRYWAVPLRVELPPELVAAVFAKLPAPAATK